MTQSKKDDTLTINLDDYKLDDILDTTGDITINLDNTMGATTTYWAGDSVSNITFDTSTTDGTFTLDTNTSDTIDIGWIYNNVNIDPERVERMCEHYPGLEKVWRNFKSVYDMCNQDYKGKLKEQGLDDDIPF